MFCSIIPVETETAMGLPKGATFPWQTRCEIMHYRCQNKLTCKLLKVWEGRRIQSCRWWTGCRTLPVSSRFVWMSPTGSNLDCQVWEEQNHSQKSNYFVGFFSDFVCTIHLTIENEMWHQIVTNVKMWNQILLANYLIHSRCTHFKLADKNIFLLFNFRLT